MAEYIERIGNIHIHTTLSDGQGEHTEIVEHARRAGLDYLIVTDHNAYAPESQGWHGDTLLLVGEEVHDPAHSDESHFLVFDARDDLAIEADSPGQLIRAVNARSGLGFIAHPYEHSGAYAREPEINWADWQVEGYTGLELWNYMSEFKSYVRTLSTGLLYVFWPKLAITGPYPETLAQWDNLLGQRRVVAIGGSDAHAKHYSLGPLRRQVFGYAHLFRALNTHLLVAGSWTRDVAQDGRLVYEALSAGRCFVAYDGLAPARGFSFSADCAREHYAMGQEIPAREGTATGPIARFHATVPAPAHLRLVLNGYVVAEARGKELSFESRTPGAYRLEAWRSYALKERGWIFSNPIYLRPALAR